MPTEKTRFLLYQVPSTQIIGDQGSKVFHGPMEKVFGDTVKQERVPPSAQNLLSCKTFPSNFSICFLETIHMGTCIFTLSLATFPPLHTYVVDSNSTFVQYPTKVKATTGGISMQLSIGTEKWPNGLRSDRAVDPPLAS
jgi:hypothetical protein